LHLAGAVPGVDPALLREWEEVQAEVVVLRKEPVEVVLDEREVLRLNPLFHGETLDALDGHGRDHTDRPDSSYRRPEKVVPRPAFVRFSPAVHQLEARDRLADEAPVPSGPVYIGGEDARDALRVVRGQRTEGPSFFQKQLHHVPHAGAALHGDLLRRPVLVDEAAIVIQRDQGAAGHHPGVEGMRRTEHPYAP
jgi:hypothetical protein